MYQLFDWPSLVMTLLGGTSALGIWQAVKYRRENKALKQNEVAVSDVEKQRQQIELAEMYKDKVVALLDQLSEKQDNGSHNQHRILEKLDTLDARMDKVEGIVSNIVVYLDGGLQDFLKAQAATLVRKKKSTPKPKTHGDN